MAAAKKDRTDLLKRIRDNFHYYTEAWRSVREEARIDMRYIAGDPWDPEERKMREDADRPCMTWDELNPYINKLVNNPKQNKRAVQVNPRGNGADDKTAELRGNIIREIEYNSKAQAAYSTGFQGAAERSYGWWRVGKRFTTAVGKSASTDAFNQELYIGRIPNPDCVLPEPNFKETDASDMMGCFVLDRMRMSDYRRDYPKAEKVSFTADDIEIAPDWIFGDKEIQVAEYWEVTTTKRTMHVLDSDAGPVALYEDDEGFDIKRSTNKRDIEQRLVTQYITNGLEILDEVEIEIPWIPLIPVFGKEIYVNEGGGSKRMLISLTRMARDPFMSYCYYRSQEAEEAGLTPKVPYIGYTGQFKTMEAEWQTANKIPRAFLQADPVMDATGTQVLPLPERQPFTPNFQAYEVACEAARRGVQTAMSGNILPTAAQRQNEKSGVALKEIDSQEDQGTFHFIENYNAGLELTGRILDAWIPYVYDTKREVGVRKADGTHATVTINDPAGVNPQTQEPEVWDATKGEHGVTITVGPSDDSERERVGEFVDLLVSNIEAIAPLLPPGAAAKMLALSVTMKNLGPTGKEMADTISPPQDQQAIQQQMAQGQATIQQQSEALKEMQAELQKLQLEKAGKVIQGETQKQIMQMQNDIKVLVALIEAKNQNTTQEQQMYQEFMIENHGAAHAAAMQAVQHGHERNQAAGQQAHERGQAAAAAQTDSAQSSQEHGQTQDQQITAAALQPQPESSQGQ